MLTNLINKSDSVFFQIYWILTNFHSKKEEKMLMKTAYQLTNFINDPHLLVTVNKGCDWLSYQETKNTKKRTEWFAFQVIAYEGTSNLIFVNAQLDNQFLIGLLLLKTG